MEELILKAQNGDTQAFTELILNINDDLYKIAKTRITNETDIEDAVQETMIETYKSIKKIKNPNQFKKWIIKVLINKCNRIYRRKYKKDISIDEYNLDQCIKSNNYKDIENELDFVSLIKDLKYEERIIIMLYYMENYSVKEINTILNMNENTITTHLYRAKQKIKKNILEGKICLVLKMK